MFVYKLIKEPCKQVQQAARCAAIVLAREQTASIRRAVRGWAQHPKPKIWHPKPVSLNIIQ